MAMLSVRGVAVMASVAKRGALSVFAYWLRCESGSSDKTADRPPSRRRVVGRESKEASKPQALNVVIVYGGARQQFWLELMTNSAAVESVWEARALEQPTGDGEELGCRSSGDE